MIYNSVAEIFEANDKARGELLESINSMSEKDVYFKSGNAWSPAEIIKHLAKTESQLIRLFLKLLEAAEKEAASSDGNLNPPVSLAEAVAELSNVKLESPEILKPADNVNIADSLAKLEESRNAILGLRQRIEKTDVSKAVFPHPFAGELNLYQWLAFIGLHEKRHLAQIAKLKNRK